MKTKKDRMMKRIMKKIEGILTPMEYRVLLYSANNDLCTDRLIRLISMLRNDLNNKDILYNIKNEVLELRKRVVPSKELELVIHLFELNEWIAEYTRYQNRMKKVLLGDKTEHPIKDILLLSFDNKPSKNLWENLGYETAFSGTVKNRLESVLQLFPKFIIRMLKYITQDDIIDIDGYLGKRKMKAVEAVKKSIKMPSTNMEVQILENIGASIVMVAELGDHIKLNKSDRRYLKTLITKLDKIFNWYYGALVS